MSAVAIESESIWIFFLYSVTPKPDRWDFVNIEKIHNKYQLLVVRFIIVIHPPRYGEI